VSCQIVRSNGIMLVACSRSKRGPSCSYCSRPGTLLCDFPVQDGKTCDKRLCGQCAKETGKDEHQCRIHQIRGDLPWRAAAAVLLVAVLLGACRDAGKPVIYDEYECRSCAAGEYCPQFCTERGRP
jgi:hypothetical protein